MKTSDKVLRAVEQAEEILELAISYCTDDDGKLTYLFPVRAPGLKMYASSFSRPLARMSIDAIATEIVADLGRQTKRPVGRPSLDVERHNITITSVLWQKAEHIGDGNAAAGIRLALEAYD